MTVSRPSVRRQIQPGLRQGNSVKQARAYLYSRHPTGFGISPARFAAASQETGTSFDELIRWISRMYAGGQQESTFREQDISRAAGAA